MVKRKRARDSLSDDVAVLTRKFDERTVVAKLLPTPAGDEFAHLLDVVEWPALVRAPPHRLRSLLSCSRAPSH